MKNHHHQTFFNRGQRLGKSNVPAPYFGRGGLSPTKPVSRNHPNLTVSESAFTGITHLATAGHGINPLSSVCEANQRLEEQMTSNLANSSSSNSFDIKRYQEYLGTSGSATLGSGCFGTVKRYRHIVTGEIIAIKTVQKAFLKKHDMLEQMKREIRIHSTLNHPNIVTYIGHQETSQAFYLGMEYANGGNLFAKLKDFGKFSPRRSAYYLQQVLKALSTLHSLGLLHRDLKPENLLLFVDENGNEGLKLSDFGWSNEALVRKSLAILNPDEKLNEGVRQTFCGTREYLSPEMLLAEPHSFSIDLWAIGVLAYEMLTGKAPFEGSGMFSKIIDGTVQFPPNIDPDAVHFIRLLLRRKPTDRPTAIQALRHNFILKNCATHSRTPSPRRSSSIPSASSMIGGNNQTQQIVSPAGTTTSKVVQNSRSSDLAKSDFDTHQRNESISTLTPPTSSSSDAVDKEVQKLIQEKASLKNEMRYYRLKSQQLTKRCSLMEAQIVKGEQKLNEQKAESDRFLMQFGPILRSSLKAAGGSSIARSNEASDVLILANDLHNAVKDQQKAIAATRNASDYRGRHNDMSLHAINDEKDLHPHVNTSARDVMSSNHAYNRRGEWTNAAALRTKKDGNYNNKDTDGEGKAFFVSTTMGTTSHGTNNRNSSSRRYLAQGSSGGNGNANGSSGNHRRHAKRYQRSSRPHHLLHHNHTTTTTTTTHHSTSRTHGGSGNGASSRTSTQPTNNINSNNSGGNHQLMIMNTPANEQHHHNKGKLMSNSSRKERGKKPSTPPPSPLMFIEGNNVLATQMASNVAHHSNSGRKRTSSGRMMRHHSAESDLLSYSYTDDTDYENYSYDSTEYTWSPRGLLAHKL